MKSIVSIILGIICVLLAVLCVSLYRTSVKQGRTSEELENQLTEMQEKEMNALVVRRISQQMEDIAYQQKEISDRQREEAMMQTRIANEMRMQAEIQRRNAEYAKKDAVEAFQVAEEQRMIAQDRQLQAEYAKSVADTLGYIALARSLSSLSQIQYQAKNFELAALMAYAAYTFTVRYNGNLYLPEVYNALAMNSHAVSAWNEHKGGISRIVASPMENDVFYTISKYGEVIRWQINGQSLNSKFLFKDSAFDFRDIFIDSDNTLYALSFDGRLVIIPRNGNSHIVTFPGNGRGFQYLLHFQDDMLAGITDAAIIFFSMTERKVRRSISLPYPVSAVGQRQNDYLLFCRNSSLMRMKKDGSLFEEQLPLNIHVTSCAWSDHLGIMALGTNTGTVFLMNEKNKIFKRLIGHQSEVTQVAFEGNNLFSSSYDLHLKMWDKSQNPINLTTSTDWIYCFYLSDSGCIWVGDESGTLSRIVISPSQMASRIKETLSRNFTQEEWNTYIGANVPFEIFKP